MKRPFFKRPSQRDIRNSLIGLEALALGTTPVFEQPKKKAARRGRQPESLVTDAVKEWRKLRPDVAIYRNNCGAYEYAPGRWLRYGLTNGSSDFIGWQTITITPAMCGQKIAQFLAIECKTEEGVLRPEQQEFIERVRDAGGKAGVARSAHDCEEITKP